LLWEEHPVNKRRYNAFALSAAVMIGAAVLITALAM